MARRKDFELDGALALVTGAGSGIGREVAVSLARHGTRVLVVDIDGEAAEKVAAACSEQGPGATAVQCDVADGEAVTALAATTLAGHGPVDVVVANAGVGMSARLTDMTVEDWRWIRGVNLDGVVHTLMAYGPQMLERGRGHAAVVSSGLAYTMRATEPAYVATKAAVLALAQSVRADWRPRGVGVSAICPGVIDTPIIDTTRFLGAQSERRSATARVFHRGHPPDLVAREIIRAVREDRTVVPVGWESKAGWWIHRFGPLRLHQAMARRAL